MALSSFRLARRARRPYSLPPSQLHSANFQWIQCRSFYSWHEGPSCALYRPPWYDAPIGRVLFSSSALGQLAQGMEHKGGSPHKISLDILRGNFRDTLEVAVRKYLRSHCDNAFLPLSATSRERPWRDPTTIEALAALNGFRSLPSVMAPLSIEGAYVELGEGVVAVPIKTVDKDYILFSRPSGHEGTNHSHHPFVEEDFTAYHLLETTVENKLIAWEESIYRKKLAFIARARHPIQTAYETIYTPAKEMVKSWLGENGIKLDNAGMEVKRGGKDDISSAPMTKKNLKTEDVLIMSPDGGILLVQDVPPLQRLLVLPRSHSNVEGKARRSDIFSPYRLGHQRAGAIIYASLVVFGAVPLTYRSLQYALDYPALTNVVAVSVVGIVSYGLWASRASAQTRQSAAVMGALNSRILGRDEAVLIHLREAAVAAITDTVMAEYLAWLEQNKEAGKETFDFISIPFYPTDIAVELGILHKTKETKDLGEGRHSVDLVALQNDIAHARLIEYILDKPKDE